jgi:hypothetical protein
MLPVISRPVDQAQTGHRVLKDSESSKNRPWLHLRLGPRDHDVVRQIDNWKVQRQATERVTTAIRLVAALEAGDWAAAVQIYPRLGLVGQQQESQRTPTEPFIKSLESEDLLDPGSQDSEEKTSEPVRVQVFAPESPDPSPPLPPTPASQAGPLRPELMTLYASGRGITFHLARRGEEYTLCGQLAHYLLNAPRQGVEYRRCEKCDQVLNPPPERAIVYAYHNSIPAGYRPTKPDLGRNTPVAKDLLAWARGEGLPLERVVQAVGEYVKQSYPGYLAWAQADLKRPLVMSLEHVAKYLPAWLTEQARKEKRNGSAGEPSSRYLDDDYFARKEAEVFDEKDLQQPEPRPQIEPCRALTSWLGVLGALQVQLNRATYDTWLRHARLVEVDTQGEKDRMVVTVPNDYIKDWINRHLLPSLTKSVNSWYNGGPGPEPREAVIEIQVDGAL